MKRRQLDLLVITYDLTTLEKIQRLINYESIFELHIVQTINRAHNIIKHKHIDLVILDLKVKNFQSAECCKAIKADPKTSHIKIIAIADQNTSEEKLLSYESGIDEYIPRENISCELPILIKKLLGLIEFKKPHIINYKTLTLDTYNNQLFYKKIIVNLSNQETLIMDYILRGGQSSTNADLRRFIQTKTGNLITVSAITVIITRLRRKFYQQLGMRLIKNRYGKGYYIGL